MSKFSAEHYNAIAKEIREEIEVSLREYDPMQTGPDNIRKKECLAKVSALCNLALRLARRFRKDNELFSPVVFLDRCSPDTDLYPLSELWDEDEEARVIQVEG